MSGLILAADFETETTAPTYVWSWGAMSVGDKSYAHGNNMQSFIKYIIEVNPETVYFHNAGFDLSFIQDYILARGYSHVKLKGRQKLKRMEYTTCISDTREFYSAEVRFTKDCTIKFLDSYKMYPVKLSKYGEYLGEGFEKLDIDYTRKHVPGEPPTPDEERYQKRDCEILREMVVDILENGMGKITIGSNALADYRKIIGAKQFDAWFPVLSIEVDKEMRPSYRGGFTYLNPDYVCVDTGRMCSVDYNSMYPSVMDMYLLPCGIPAKFEGKYKPDSRYPLYIQGMMCTFSLKPGGIPMIQLHNSSIYAVANTYIDSCPEPTYIMLANPDIELFFEMYDVEVLTYTGGYMMAGKYGMFSKFLEYHAGRKKKAQSEGNMTARYREKITMNSLYGKFGSRLEGADSVPYYDEEEKLVKYYIDETEDRKGVYLPIAVFTTAYARKELFTGIKANKDRFIYCDTDSMHLIGDEPPVGIKLHDENLGAWKVEGSFADSRHLRAKSYILVDDDGKETIKCAGMSESAKKCFNFENFLPGASNLDENGEVIKGCGKLQKRTVQGGAILIESPFTIIV